MKIIIYLDAGFIFFEDYSLNILFKQLNFPDPPGKDISVIP